MPKLITTQTRIADLGKPRIIIIGGGFGGIEIPRGLKDLRTQVVPFDRYTHHTFRPLLYQVATSGPEMSSAIFPFPKQFPNSTAFKFQGLFAWFVWMFIHLIPIIGFKNKLLTFLTWIWNYFSYDKSNRLMISRPKDDIRF
jgi:NADH dehydrogenase FAD-containing subunit